MSALEVLTTVVREHDAGRRAALCVIVATRGSTPQPAGSMVCIDEAAGLTGTLGGGCVEADVRRRAHQLLATGESALVTFALDDDFGYDDGMICGGQMDVAISVMSADSEIEPLGTAVTDLSSGRPAIVPMRVATDNGRVDYRVNIEAAPTLVIAGAGHIGRVLGRIMVPLGFNVHVVDDRADYANSDRFPVPMRPIVGDIASTLGEFPTNASTYFVIVTRGHKHDEKALEAIVDSGSKYIGMIGSRRKIKVIYDDLRHRGVTDQQLSRVHAPIGLGINAVTTEEIAISIAAELIATRRADHRKVVEGPFSAIP